MRRRCEAQQADSLVGRRCGRPAIGRFQTICLHEHIKNGWLCGTHALMQGVCMDCLYWSGEHNHLCPFDVHMITAEEADMALVLRTVEYIINGHRVKLVVEWRLGPYPLPIPAEEDIEQQLAA